MFRSTASITLLSFELWCKRRDPSFFLSFTMQPRENGFISSSEDFHCLTPLEYCSVFSAHHAEKCDLWYHRIRFYRQGEFYYLGRPCSFASFGVFAWASHILSPATQTFSPEPALRLSALRAVISFAEAGKCCLRKPSGSSKSIPNKVEPDALLDKKQHATTARLLDLIVDTD